MKTLKEIWSIIPWFIGELKHVKTLTLIALFILWNKSIDARYGVEIFTGVMAIILPTIFIIRSKEKPAASVPEVKP